VVSGPGDGGQGKVRLHEERSDELTRCAAPIINAIIPTHRPNPFRDSLRSSHRFRLAQALLSLASSSLPTSSTTSTYLSSAQNQLSIVLSIEPGNSQALNLAQEGLELSKRIIRTDKDGVHSKEVKEKARTDEEKLLQEAFNPTSDGTEVGAGEMGGSDYMADNWEAYQESLRKRKETEKAKDKGEEVRKCGEAQRNANGVDFSYSLPGLTLRFPLLCHFQKKISSLPPSSPSAQNIPSTTNLVNSLKATKKKSQPPPPDIQETTAPVWDDMAASEASLTKNYNSVVEANSFVVSASEVMESLKTTESNYSDSWRNEHVKRRYNGKDRKHRVKKGGAAWEELEGTEKGAVKVVKELGDRKKKLSEKGGVGNTLEVKEGEEGGVKDWRKKLKMRRMGVEVKTKILEKKEKVKDVWEDMMGRENEEVSVGRGT